jgi:hypothetical protein
MSNLILHVGLHKTGTSAIQAFANSNRELLLAKGLFYPEYEDVLNTKAHAHHELAHSLAGHEKSRLSKKQLATLVEKWKRKSGQTKSHILISSEAFSRHVDLLQNGTWLQKRKAYLNRVADIFSDFRIKVIIILRRQDDYIRSLYQEEVMRNINPGINNFRKYYLQYLERNEENCYLNIINLFEEYFPEIEVLTYEDLISGHGLIRNFFLKLECNIENMPQPGYVRQSLSPPETMLKLLLNPHTKAAKQNEIVLNWIKSETVQDVLQKYYKEKEYGFWASFDERQNFLACFNEMNEKIKISFSPVKETLFPLLLVSDEPPLVHAIPDDCKAKLRLESILNS